MAMRLLRWCVGLAWLALAGLFVALPAAGFALGTPRPPPLPAGFTPLRAQPDGDGLHAGHGTRRPVGALTWVDLRGSPEDIGAAQGALLQDRIGDLEQDMVATLVERVPGFPARHLLLGAVGLANRTLPDWFTAEELRELHAATASGDPALDRMRHLGPPFQRAVHYHALHDVSQYLIDNPLVRPIQVGCSAFAAAGADGGVVAGRIFDFEGGPRFDLDKVVYTVHPERGHAFIHVAWPGMTGVVTGMNDAGLWVSLNAAASAGGGVVGRPIVMAAREILQHAGSIAEAEAVLARSRVFVSSALLIASGRERRAVVAEIGPGGLALRPWHDGRISATNHFQDPRWAMDPRNRERMAQGTTQARLARLEELIASGPMDATRAVAVLRDRRGPGGRDLGFAHRSTINAWIAAHLAVADLERGILWVSEPRHGLGAMRAFTLAGPLPAADLPADPELARCLADLPRWNALCARLADGIADPAERAAAAQAVVALNPGHFAAHWLAGLASDDPAARRAALERALALAPAYAADAAAIRRALAGAHAVPGDPPRDP
ncbi:MAG: hypothetical protein RLZZ127_2612 [Planctomycetota bacterium]|jgi:hypothetical protein